ELERSQTAQREQTARREVEVLSDCNARLTHEASTDALTGVANRGALDARLREFCNAARNSGETPGLLLLDVDRFKRLNDTCGHPSGDEALRQIGACLKQLAGDALFAARYGGEEFAIVV